MSRLALSAALAVGLLGAGCASVPSDPEARAEFRQTNDPLEPFNRGVFAVNQFIDRVLIKPVAKGYVRAVPRPARDSIRNFVSNLNEPVVFANNVLQGQFRRAATTAGRFAIDSTVGVAGLFDFARTRGLRKQTGDFGQTLFAWGAPEGPYLVLPLIGPSNPRDCVGLGADSYLNPYRYAVEDNDYPLVIAYGPAVAGGLDERARAIDALDAIQKEAVDYYASLRSLFRQNRAAQLRGGEASPTPGAEGFYEDPGATPQAKGP